MRYSESGGVDPGSTLYQATAATAGTRSYSYLPEHQAWALVVNCTSGQVEAMGAFRRCSDGPRALIGVCAGGHFEITVEVTKAQSRTWGLATYHTPQCKFWRRP